MKLQGILLVAAMSGMTTLCSCSEEVMNDKGMEAESRLTVLTRSSGDDDAPSVSPPVRFYVFNSEDQCVASQTLDETNAPFSVELPEGVYDIYAIGAADESRMDFPTARQAEKTSALSLKEGMDYGDLMTANSTVTLSAKGNNTLTLGMERKVCQVVSITIRDVPEEVGEVSISISPLREGILLNGTYQGEEGSRDIPLVRQEDGHTWKEGTTGIFLLPSVGKPTISVKIDNATYSYTCEEEMAANYKIDIEGSYTRQASSADVTLNGTVTGVSWAGEKSIRFNFSEESPANGDDDGVIDEPIPEVGSLFHGCYVLAVNEKEVTILSSIEKRDIVGSTETQQRAYRIVSEAVMNWSVPGITAEWRLIGTSDLQLIEDAYDDINSPELGSNRYFYEDDGILMFRFRNGTLTTDPMLSDMVYLRPVATLTFR